MFRAIKSAAVSAARPFLRRFIDEESLDADLLNFDLSGTLELRDVKLNTDELVKLIGVDLPVKITGAVVQRLKLQVSWMHLLSSPIRAELEGLYLVASLTKEVDAEARLTGE